MGGLSFRIARPPIGCGVTLTKHSGFAFKGLGFRIAENSGENLVPKIREYTSAFSSGILPAFIVA